MIDPTAPGRRLVMEVPADWFDRSPEERDAWLDQLFDAIVDTLGEDKPLPD